MDYDVIYGNTVDDLIEKVKAAIDRGWKPQGGISVVHYSYNDGEYDHQIDDHYQAMVKEQ